MGRRAKTRMDEVVRNFMDAYRDSRSRDPVVITDQIDVRSWVPTSFQPVKFDFNDVVRTVMRYRPDVLDTNRPGILRLEILLEMADASRWRLYPQAIPIQEWPHQIAALEGPAESRAAVFGRWHEMVAAAAIDRLGHRKAEQWLPLKFLEEWLSVAVGDRRQSEVAVGINVTNGDKFQWYRHFSCYSAADFTAHTEASRHAARRRARVLAGVTRRAAADNPWKRRGSHASPATLSTQPTLMGAAFHGPNFIIMNTTLTRQRSVKCNN